MDAHTVVAQALGSYRARRASADAGAAEAEVGDEHGRLTAGDLAVIPAMVPHGLLNVGSETVKVVGFFSESEIISTFNEPMQPIGAAVLNQGSPPPA